MSGKDMKSLYMIIAVLGVVLVSGCTDYINWSILYGSGTTTTLPPQCGPHGYGDVNNDGAVNSIDSSLILQHSAGMLNLATAFPGSMTRADVNEDSSVTTVDAAIILQYNAGLINTFATCSSSVNCVAGTFKTTTGVCHQLCGAPQACQNLQPGQGVCGACGVMCDSNCNAVSNGLCCASPQPFCGCDGPKNGCEVCESSCGAAANCDGRQPGSVDGFGGVCNNACQYITPPAPSCKGDIIGADFSTSYYTCASLAECPNVYPDVTTAMGTFPVSHRTIANGELPFGTRIFVDFGDGHSWTGTYVVEDRGSAVGPTHLDIFCEPALCSYIGDPDNPPTMSGGVGVYYSNC